MREGPHQRLELPCLRARGPYDFDRSFRRIVCAVVATRHPEMGQREQPLETGEFPLALRTHGRPLLVGLKQAPDGGIQPRLLIGAVRPADVASLTAELRRILCLDHDLEAFYEVVAGDRILAPLTRRFRGLRLVLTPTPFQGLVHAILFQQISYAAAQTVEHRLLDRWGERLVYGERHFPLFPSADQLAGLSDMDLGTVGIPQRKARAIREVARQTAAGILDLEALAAQAEPDLADRRLESIRGIGPWTAHHAIIRAMGMTDCLPLEDPGLRRAVAEQYGWSQVSAQQLASLAEHWVPWRSYATYYLWNTFWE